MNNPVAGFIETTSAPWCTAQGEGIQERMNYVELTFTERIVVEFLESTGLLESWVSNFSIQYSQSESGEDFITYGVLEAPQVYAYLCVCAFHSIKSQKLQSCCISVSVGRFGLLCLW